MKITKYRIAKLVLTAVLLVSPLPRAFALGASAPNLFVAFEAQDDPAFEDFKKARELMLDDRYPEAIQAFSKLVNKYPNANIWQLRISGSVTVWKKRASTQRKHLNLIAWWRRLTQTASGPTTPVQTW